MAEQDRKLDVGSLAETANLSEEELLARLVAEDWEAEEPDSDDQPLIPEQLVLPFLLQPSEPYHPRDHDRAIREASLASGTSWKERAGLLSFLATNSIEVSFGSRELPLDIAAARKEITKLGESTVIVGRLLFLLWNTRHKQMTRRKGNSVPVLISEILRLMGHAKHTKMQGANLQYTDGYRPEQKRKVIQDAALLAAFQVRARIMEGGTATSLNILGPYLKCSLITREIGDRHYVVGFYVEPGDWIKAYEAFPEHPADNALVRIDTAIYQLDTQNDKYAIRIALALTERWRDQVSAFQAAQMRGEALSANFSTPQKMSDLLAASMIAVPREHVRDRFIPRIERAIQALTNPLPVAHRADDEPSTRIIIGSAQPLKTIVRNKEHWEMAWLDMPWVILPPTDLLNACTTVDEATPKKPLKLRQPRKK